MEQSTGLTGDREWGFHDYLSLAIRRKWIILSVFIVIFSAATAYFYTRPPVYKAASTFIIESSDKGSMRAGPLLLQSDARPFGFYETLVRSKMYKQRVAKAAQLDSALEASPEFTSGVLGGILDGLSITQTDYDDLYSLTIESNNPVIAYEMASIAIDEFKKRCQEIELEESRNIVGFVNIQIEEARSNLEHAERELQEFKEKTKITDVDQAQGGILGHLADIESQLDEVETQRQLSQANLDTYQARFKSLKNTEAPSVWSNETPEVLKLRKEIDQLEEQKRKVVDSESISSRQLTVLDAKIETKKNNLRNAYLSANKSKMNVSFTDNQDEESAKSIFNERIVTEELNLYVLQNKESFLRSLIEKYRLQHPNILEHTIELAQLQRTKAVNEKLYTFLVEKAEEAKINAATGTGGIRIVDEPSLPEKPKSSGKKRNMMVAVILAFGLGFGLAFVVDYLDNSIYSLEDIKRLGDFTVLGTIPFMKKRDRQAVSISKKHNHKEQHGVDDLFVAEDRMNGYRNKVISLIQSKEPVVDAYRHVRTNLQFANVDISLKRIMVTSSIPGEGKTLSAANLAISFAELGKRILVVDCDLRKSHQHILFNVRKSPGLSDFLARDIALEKTIYMTHVPNLYVIPAGTMPPNPAEMLASNKMNDLIATLEQNFDFVIYDTPPIIAVTDPVLLSKRVGNVIMVIRFGKTNRHIVSDSVNRLTNVNSDILGVIFNGMQKAKGYGYYKYDYAYYQSSYYSEEAPAKKKKISLV